MDTKIVYSNTMENENIKERLTEVSVTVKRESGFYIGGMDIVDETHIFEGRDNHLNLYLDYTNFFKQYYNCFSQFGRKHITIFKEITTINNVDDLYCFRFAQ